MLLVAKSTEVYLCYDLGGTKLRAAHISASGRILGHATGEVNQRAGFDGLIRLFKELSEKLDEGVKVKAVSVAAAGPLHPAKGILLDPTNFFTDQKSWGVVSLTAPLKKVFKKPVYLENDAAAAVLGERWRGGHGKGANLIAMTLGTGVGVGVIANDVLVRAGRGLHPEAGHIPINSEDKNFPCGCGAYGCVEAYLAGSHFAKRMSARVGRSLTGREAVQMAKDGDFQLQSSFKEYGRHLAQAIRTLCVMFAPEVVVLSGGFSHASSLFLNETEKVLPGMMERYRDGIDLVPKVKVSKLKDDAGILGAAYIAKNA